MSEISVPVVDLRAVAAGFQRVSGDLLDMQSALARLLNVLDAKSRQAVLSDERLAELTAQARATSEGAATLARTLQVMLDAFEEMDRQAAAAIPLAPYVPFPLPLGAPPRRAWPQASAPASTPIRPVVVDSTQDRA